MPDDGVVPAGGRPILAFTHGTIGVARSCAPSLLDGAYVEQMWGLDAFIDAGWIVAAPDYLGLGGEGVHPYLAGHSQGGHAAMFTGQQAPTYAPELDLVAVAGLAPASELASFIEANDGTTFGNMLGAYAVVAWDRAFDDIDATDIIDPAVLPIVERLADACVATGPEAVGLLTDAELLQLGFLVSPIWETEPWASRIAENTPGAEVIDAPLLIVQGTDDVLGRPQSGQSPAGPPTAVRDRLPHRGAVVPVPLFLTGGATEDPTPLTYVVLFAMYIALAFVTIFFNTALVSGAYERLRGGDPTLGSAGAAGLAWSMVTFLVIPVFVIEDIGVAAAVKRSGALFKQTWGENVTARVGFGLVGFRLAVLWVIAVTMVMAALSSIFQTALYLHATQQHEPGGYVAPTQFQQAFTPKGAAAA